MRLSGSNPKSVPCQLPLVAVLLLTITTSVWLLSAREVAAAESPTLAAPEFSLPGLSGDKALQDYRGQFLYVDFWASWCGPCRQSFPWMNEMLDKYDAQGLKIIAINLDESRDDAMRFLDQVPTDVDIAFDASGATAEIFNVRGMPSSYLINPDGEIVFSHIGFRKRDTAKLEAEIASVMGGG